MTLKRTLSAVVALAIIINLCASSAVAGMDEIGTGNTCMNGVSPDVTRELGIRAEKQSEQLAIPENRHEEWAKEKATEFTAIYDSPVFQKRLLDETERLKRDVFKKPIEEYYPDSRSGSMKDQGGLHLTKHERIYVFVSSSIPLQTMRTYAAAIDQVQDPNIVMVMRGFLNGMDDINSTMIFFSRVLLKDSLCEGQNCPMFRANLEIDPLLFRRYQITEVPAVVYASNVQLLTPGGSEGIEGNASIGRFYKVTGDAALDYHLDTINKEVHEKSLSALAETMRKGFYQ